MALAPTERLRVGPEVGEGLLQITDFEVFSGNVLLHCGE